MPVSGRSGEQDWDHDDPPPVDCATRKKAEKRLVVEMVSRERAEARAAIAALREIAERSPLGTSSEARVIALARRRLNEIEEAQSAG